MKLKKIVAAVLAIIMFSRSRHAERLGRVAVIVHQKPFPRVML